MVKTLPAMQETQVRFLGRDDPLEKEMATHSSTLAWKIPWMEEPDGLLSLFTVMHWRRKWQPTTVFLPEESQGQGSLVAAVYGVTQSWTRLK